MDKRKRAEGGMLEVGFELDIAEFMYASFIQICLEWNNPQLSSRTPRSFAPQGSVVSVCILPSSEQLELEAGILSKPLHCLGGNFSGFLHPQWWSS